jgi:signal transduction histidine kinase/ActR/RegA family two-component response regulator
VSIATDARIRVESVRTLYRQLPNSFAAAMVVTIYMIATAWPYTQLKPIGTWLGAQALAQAHRFWIYRRYTRAELTTANAQSWSRRYSEYMAVAGLVWGSSIFLFVHLDVPISLALTMCGLYGIAAGSVPGNAYNPPGVYLFLGLIFGLVMLRMALIGDPGHIALGIASILFVAIMVLFCRVQYRTLMDGFQIRFENADLLEQLTVQKKDAEDARARAEQANLAKSQFLAAASHDLRQPLHALGLFSASLQELKLDDNGREIVARIHNNIDALEQLFNALLDISKLDAGVVRPNLASVPVETLFMRLEDYFHGIAREKGLRLSFAPTRTYVRADPMLLERILSNLVANALRYTERGGVVIGCRRLGADRVLFEVWDSGVGVAPRDQARIFDEFVQVGNPERDRRKGLGLGLAIAQRTAALLDTRIELVSRPGRGTVFRFALPRAAPAVQPVPQPEPEALDAVAGLRVLVIDDEESIRDALSRLLGQWGAEIEAVPGPAEAEALFRSGRRFDVVLADFRLRHDKTGIEAIRAIRELQSPPPKACLVTGDVDVALIGAARAEGLPLLHKPMRPAQLRAVLNFLASQPVQTAAREPAPAAR